MSQCLKDNAALEPALLHHDANLANGAEDVSNNLDLMHIHIHLHKIIQLLLHMLYHSYLLLLHIRM